jgi:pyruvate/2-oxoglutarate dehydrogenase complex dihydrolipoamide acyltransferase (E2) component
MATDVTVPTLGESITEATLGQWLKKPGDPVQVDEPIASLETDKVAVEVPSPVAGTMGEQVVAEGDTVNVGAVIARIEAGGAGAATQSPAQATVAESDVNPAGPPKPRRSRAIRWRRTLRKATARRISPCRPRFAVWCWSIISTRPRSRAPARTAA